ncbi:RagB/SusD family nutrient uptake outer membrane protein [Chitinophaga sp. Cy-1792]|uniref:RagB/SusD family nutrient uptake outer membrane protein n=1 Tax=Chitinophaga sp. Cy-1792 TaxID=2608339 RepID=UPI001423FC1C|nr:RagB/SusD family nutrient uptake outer membrane protein [Chitinophaga sp. Cy-1792]NIG54954.1 RagB/SusD family nutrient uptake outer membrane protein [Chitinophaga sp. Cy-1792]
MKIKYLVLVLIGLAFGACNKLDVAPLNIIKDQDIFTNETGVTAYLASIYGTLPIEDFQYQPNNGFMNGDGGRWQCFFQPGAICGELAGPYGGTGDAAQGFGFWPYDKIRIVNYMLTNFPKYQKAFQTDKYNQWLGEAYFCRAYLYFALVKRYGGIPIVRTLQNYPEQSITELQVPRNKEQEVYDFIASDLDSAAMLMSATSPRSRANKYVAAAYKSRAMLYAGTIAKYGASNFVDGDARQKGFAGIPADQANRYFQAAYDAAKLVEGHYSLYRKADDKIQNYTDLFLDQSSTETIYAKDYSIASGTPHSWDATMTCRLMTADGLSRAYPTLDLVERFTGPLNIVNADGTPKRFTNKADILQGLEPRLQATIYFPGATLRGYTFDAQRGIYKTFGGNAADEMPNNMTSSWDQPANLLLSGDVNQLYNGRRIVGLTGIKTDGDDLTRTGLYVRKYVNYKADQASCGLYQSTQSWIDMRYAEVLLNRAEAAMELGTAPMQADALNAINQLRDRAGATLATSNITIDSVRNERCKELAFEHHLWWDLRRWRTADKELDNRRFYGLLPYYVDNESKYIFLKQIETFQRSYNFEKKWYYEPIPGGELGKNPNLFPNNPGY